METLSNVIKVELREFDAAGNGQADVTLPASGAVIRGLKVMRGLGGGLMVHMPAWMHTRWSYVEVQWSEVRKAVTDAYWQALSGGTLPAQAQDGPGERAEVPVCSFRSQRRKVETMADVALSASGTVISSVYISYMAEDGGSIRVSMPLYMHGQWNIREIGWEPLSEIVAAEYRRQILGETALKKPTGINVTIKEARYVDMCLADVKLPNKLREVKGFRLKKIEGRGLIISMPHWMGRWVDSEYSWFDLCQIISSAYGRYEVDMDAAEQGEEALELPAGENGGEEAVPNQPEGPSILPQANALVKREKNELGRIKNAENSSFRFFPRTVLRLEDALGDVKQKRKIFDLVNAMAKGSVGGIGPFEVNILSWVEKLRYVTSTMLLDLIRAGYVSSGWRGDVTQAKLAKIITRMCSYDLINLTRFMTVDDEGNHLVSSYSVMRITTLGKNGSTLLRELGRSRARYNAFDIFQDGNTVKRYLSANQWLIYWLTTYKAEVEESYETSYVIHQKGVEFSGARIYATVTLNDYPMVAEPVRRVEEFEAVSSRQALRDKLERFMTMFDNLDQLYHGKDEISFSQRPIIVLLCEDDAHMDEIWEAVHDLLEHKREQIVWFTTDLRIFNYDMKGQRFLTMDGGEKQPVKLDVYFGCDKELTAGEDRPDTEGQACAAIGNNTASRTQF